MTTNTTKIGVDSASGSVRTEPRRMLRFWPPVAVVAVFLGSWELACRMGVVNAIIVPAPTDIASSLVTMVGEGYFWRATWVTMSETVLGFVIGVLSAWALGTALGTYEWAKRAFYPLIVGFQITPRVALAPLFLTWFGFGITSKVVMAATICFFPVLINVLVGLQTVDKNAVTLMRSLGASRVEQYTKLMLPSSLPLIFAGIKNAITLALIGAIVAEFVGASEGMGVLIKTLNFQLDVAGSFAVVVALMFFGLLLYWLVEFIDTKLVFWRTRV